MINESNISKSDCIIFANPGPAIVNIECVNTCKALQEAKLKNVRFHTTMKEAD
jgi:hypothetical protein